MVREGRRRYLGRMDPTGRPAPLFTLPDAEGRPCSLAALRGRNVVLFFYPKDDTMICTKEACAFRDVHAEFQDLDAEVIGISGDDAASHQRFASRWQLPYRLLTDGDGSVAAAYGVRGLLGLLKGRSTFVIDAQGIVRAVINDHFRAQRHVREALDALRGQRAASV